MDQQGISAQNTTVNFYDRVRGGLEDAGNTIKTRVATIRQVQFLVGDVLTYLVETIRHEGGDTIFIEVTSKDGTIRVVLPPKVANTIARQRDALTKKTRQRVGREQAAERKAQGIEPFGGKRYKRS